MPDSAPALAITDITVVDVRTGERRPGQTVVVNGNRITEVGASATANVPRGATIVAGRGLFLIPGLWDMHTHAASLKGRTLRFWALFRAHGITGTREMGNDLESLRFARGEAARRPDQAPRVVWSSPMLDGDPPTYESAIAIGTAEQARARVREMKEAGFDFLKVYNGLSRDAFLALAEEARRVGIPIAGELPDAVLPNEAANSGMRSFEHLWNLFESCVPGAGPLRDDLRRLEKEGATAPASEKQRLQSRRDHLWLTGYDAVCAEDLATSLAKDGTWQVPTLAVNRSYAYFDVPPPAEDPRRRWIPAKFLTHWEKLRTETLASYGPETATAWHARYEAEQDLVRRLAQAGAGILAGSDAVDWEPYIYPGSSLHDELALLVEAGLTPLQALQSATLNPALFLGRSDLGTVESGKLADLVLLDADPLVDIRNLGRIHGVVFDGRYQARPELDALISDAIARASE